MKENRLNQISKQLITIGAYFSTTTLKELKDNVTIKNNILMHLLNVYLLINEEQDIENENTICNANEEEKYLTRKEIISLYYPLFTQYGLNQAINKKEIPFHKRGSKYFFKKSEIDDWINNKDNAVQQTIKYV